MSVSFRRYISAGLAVLMWALVPGHQMSGFAQAPPSPSSASIPLSQLIPAIDAHFRRVQQEAHIPGLVYGIVRDGQLLHTGSMGVQDLDSHRPVDARTLFRIASMSKAFTALAVLKLRDEGRLSLDALAETYVPEMRGWRYPTSDSPRIRVRDLLSHAAGFVTDDPWGDRQQILPEADFTRLLRAGVPFTRAPGLEYEYSNFGYALLGRIIGNVSGRPFKDYIEETIMRPLGMISTGYDINESPLERRALGYRWENDAFVREPDMAHGEFGAMGGVQTNATDYSKWMSFLLSAWPARDGAEEGPVVRASVREMSNGLNFPQRGPRPGSTGATCTQAMAYGMGLRVAEDCEVGLTLAHGGGYPGYGSFMLLLADHGIGIFAFSNRTYAGLAGAVWDSAMELQKAGWLTGRTISPHSVLTQAYRAVGAMYESGEIAPGRVMLAMNFLMDRSEDNWRQELLRLKKQAGQCRTDAPLAASGALAGGFRWTCERGVLDGRLLLAPTEPPTIQALRLSVTAPR